VKACKFSQQWDHPHPQDMIQVASQRLSEFKVQSLINFLSAVIVLSEEDWLGPSD